MNNFFFIWRKIMSKNLDAFTTKISSLKPYNSSPRASKGAEAYG
jgi:hypothetical protein